MKKFLVLGLLLAALAAVVPAHSSPAVAFRFQGTAFLPTFPCVPGGCVGSFSGTATGQLENTGANGSGSMTASFTYGEPNCEQGNAVGSGSINGVSFTFTWTRVTATAVISGSYGGHAIRAAAAFTTTPAVPPGCLPGGVAGPITASVTGVAAGA